MTTIINAVASTGLTVTSDGSGVVKLQSAGVTTNALAWVNFNGVPATPTIRASYNVASITKSGTGSYVVNFSTPLADANFVCEVSGYDAAGGATAIKVQPYRTVSTSSQPISATNAAGTAFVDLDQVQIAVFGN